MEKTEKNNDKEDVAEKEQPISLGQVPTEYGLVYITPEGNLNQQEYLAWLGNLLLEIKEGMVGN